MYKPSVTYRLFALTMALLMLTTSVSFAVDLHYCGGQLKSFGIFQPAQSCHQMVQQPTCPHHQKLATEQGTTLKQLKKDCCRNHLEYVQSDQNFQTQTADLTLNSPLQLFLIAYIATLLNTNPAKANTSAYAAYRPPSLLKDRPVLHQTFLL